jgi:hypothetical protein
MALNIIGPTIASDRRGAESWTRANDTDIFNTFVLMPFGGSRHTAHPPGGGYQDLIEWVDFELPSAAYGGGVWEAIVELRTENATTTLTPKVRNVTDATDAVVGVAGSSTVWGTAARQALAFTPAAGKVYRVQVQKNNDDHDGWAVALLRRKHA